VTKAYPQPEAPSLNMLPSEAMLLYELCFQPHNISSNRRNSRVWTRLESIWRNTSLTLYLCIACSVEEGTL